MLRARWGTLRARWVTFRCCKGARGATLSCIAQCVPHIPPQAAAFAITSIVVTFSGGSDIITSCVRQRS
jgi:hypothetical protein